MGLLDKGLFNEEETYGTYQKDCIYKLDEKNFTEFIYKTSFNAENKYLIQISSTRGLTSKIISILPNNVDIRVIGSLTNEYAKSTAKNWDGLREKCTYSKNELIAILDNFELVESKINPLWNDFQKALYLYEYMKYSITYRKPEDSYGENKSLDLIGNKNRTRTWDSLIGIITHLSTCSGFAHIYQELCTRQGINCVKVGGKYLLNGEGSHAWNIVTINNNNFLVDIIWDTIDFEKGIDHVTGFGTVDTKKYIAKCYKELQNNLITLNNNWIDNKHIEMSKLFNKNNNCNNNIENFLKFREYDRKRAFELTLDNQNDEYLINFR